MKVILVNGSPHPKGCTYTALEEMAKILAEESIETKHFWIGNKPLGGCIDCRKCVKTAHCVFHDVVNEFLEIAGEYDAFVFGSPVHWGATSGNMKSFMDRAFCVQADSLCGFGKAQRHSHHHRPDEPLFFAFADAHCDLTLLGRRAWHESG